MIFKFALSQLLKARVHRIAVLTLPSPWMNSAIFAIINGAFCGVVRCGGDLSASLRPRRR